MRWCEWLKRALFGAWLWKNAEPEVDMNNLCSVGKILL
jgi:hypothetical protein